MIPTTGRALPYAQARPGQSRDSIAGLVHNPTIRNAAAMGGSATLLPPRSCWRTLATLCCERT